METVPVKPKQKFKQLRQGSSSVIAIAREQTDLLALLWQLDTRRPSFGCVSFRKAGTQRFEDRFLCAADLDYLPNLLLDFDRDKYDQYFCPNTFSRPSRQAEHVRKTRLAWCDIDEADPSAFNPKPSLLWRTSPGRTQAIWFWDKSYSAFQAAQYSKSLTYQFGGDKGGWNANKLLRLPGSVNHKTGYDKPKVTLLSANFKPLKTHPKATGTGAAIRSVALTEVDPFRSDADAVLRKLGSKLDRVARLLARHKTVRMQDRSKQIYFMIAGLHKAGASPDEIACVVWNSAYFQSKYPDDQRALQLEVGRVIAKLESEQ